jgi:hypothetical protein
MLHWSLWLRYEVGQYLVLDVAEMRRLDANPVAGVYVQFGCGLCAPDGWLNFDASPRLRLEQSIAGFAFSRKLFPANARYGDIIRGLPVTAGSATGVYASHVLEHMTRDNCAVALRNTFTMLQPGGTFRLIVPDLRTRAEAFLASNDDNAAHVLMERLGVTSTSGSRTYRAFLDAMGNSKHLWMWDEKSMTKALRIAGFSAVRPCAYGDNPDPMFRLVEQQERFIDGELVECALEATKPLTG